MVSVVIVRLVVVEVEETAGVVPLSGEMEPTVTVGVGAW